MLQLPAFAPLLADIGDIIGAGMAILIPVLWALRAIFAAKKEGQPQAGQQRAAPRRVPPQPPQQQPAGRGNQQTLVDEVEQFLRRAAERRAGSQPRDVEVLRPEQPAPRPRPAQRPAAPSRPAAPQARSTAPRPLSQRTPIDAVVVETDEVRLGRTPVDRHVAEHLDTRGFSSRAEQLTTVDQADEQMAAHLHSTFDHQVGSLGRPAESATAGTTVSASATADTPQTPPSALLAELFASPASIRQAIIFQEIFRRPEERW